MSTEVRFLTLLSLPEMLALESIVAATPIGDVPLIHVGAGHAGMMRLRDAIAEARRSPIPDAI